MIHLRLGLTVLCAMALMALSVSPAQAAFSWLVLKTNGEAVTHLKAALTGESDSPSLSLLLKKVFGLYEVQITCKTFGLIGFNLEPTEGGKITEGGKAKFTGCYQEGLSGTTQCEQHSSGQPAGTIVTNELKSELVSHERESGETEVVVKVTPKVGETFVTTFTSKECGALEGVPVKGVLYLKDGWGLATTHAVSHLLEAGSLTELYLLKNEKEVRPFDIDGAIVVKLGEIHAGLAWSAMGP